MELYFEVDDFDAFTGKLRRHLDVETGASADDACVEQRVVRLYDPDWHMIEVGESMGTSHFACWMRAVPWRDRRAHPSLD